MYRLHLDPAFFACPPITAGKDAFESFLWGIVTLQEITKSKRLNVLIPATTHDALFDCGCYPIQGQLHQSIAAFGSVSDIQVCDVLRIVNGLLSKLATIEHSIGVDSVLFDHLIVAPDGAVATHDQLQLEASVRDMLVLSCLAVELGAASSGDVVLMLARLLNGPSEISIQSEVLDYEGASKLEVPCEIAATFPTCSSHTEFARVMDATQLWLGPLDTDEQTVALSFNILARLHETGAQLEPFNWHFGPEFLKSAQNLGFLHEENKVKSLLRACVEVVLRQNMAATHALRTGGGGNDPQRVRGTLKAWRRDIDYEYHLHYWADGVSIEFSCVVVHNNFDIV